MYQTVQKCTKLFKNVPNCSKMNQRVTCTKTSIWFWAQKLARIVPSATLCIFLKKAGNFFRIWKCILIHREIGLFSFDPYSCGKWSIIRGVSCLRRKYSRCPAFAEVVWIKDGGWGCATAVSRLSFVYEAHTRFSSPRLSSKGPSRPRNRSLENDLHYRKSSRGDAHLNYTLP